MIEVSSSARWLREGGKEGAKEGGREGGREQGEGVEGIMCGFLSSVLELVADGYADDRLRASKFCPCARVFWNFCLLPSSESPLDVCIQPLSRPLRPFTLSPHQPPTTVTPGAEHVHSSASSCTTGPISSNPSFLPRFCVKPYPDRPPRAPDERWP